MMVSDLELQRLQRIDSNAKILYGLEGINPLIEDLLDQISIDIAWLADHLNKAWSEVNSLQIELSRIYNS